MTTGETSRREIKLTNNFGNIITLLRKSYLKSLKELRKIASETNRLLETPCF